MIWKMSYSTIDRLLAWTIIGSNIQHFYDYQNRYFFYPIATLALMQHPLCSHHSVDLSNVPPTSLCDWLHVTSNSLSALKAVHAAVPQTAQRSICKLEQLR